MRCLSRKRGLPPQWRTASSYHTKGHGKANLCQHRLVDMARCVVRFSAEDRANLEDPLEDAHHDLLIELWALCQEGGAPKVVQLEDVCSAFSGSGNKLGGLYLCKVTTHECAAKARHGSCCQPQDSASCWMTIGDSSMIEQVADTRCYLALVQRHRWHLCHWSNDLNVQAGQL